MAGLTFQDLSGTASAILHQRHRSRTTSAIVSWLGHSSQGAGFARSGPSMKLELTPNAARKLVGSGNDSASVLEERGP